jgi:hypothetical protein
MAIATTGLQVFNIDRARFEGLEFSGRYENNRFTAELAANYYLNVEFCITSGAAWARRCRVTMRPIRSAGLFGKSDRIAEAAQ